MKYNKIIRENYKYKNIYLISIAFSMLLFIFLSYFGFGIKGTEAYFSGIEPDLSYGYVITYSSNYPINFDSNTTSVVQCSDTYTVVDNIFFSAPVGYEFIGWNTDSSGTGIMYVEDDVINVDSNLYLYAQWKLIDNDDSNNDDVTDNNNPSDNDDKDEDNSGNNTDSGDNNSGSTGNGSSGNGSSNGGNSGSGTSNGNIGNGNSSGNFGNNSNSTSNSKNPIINKDDKEDDIEEVLPKIYEFKYFNGKNIYASTSCDVLEDRTCKLVYPSNNPVKIGYKFKGWSLSNLCLDDDIITYDIDINVDGNRTYYACYELDENYDKSDNKWIYLVIGIWIIALIMIYFSIRKFRKNDEND